MAHRGHHAAAASVRLDSVDGGQRAAWLRFRRGLGDIFLEACHLRHDGTHSFSFAVGRVDAAPYSFLRPLMLMGAQLHQLHDISESVSFMSAIALVLRRRYSIAALGKVKQLG